MADEQQPTIELPPFPSLTWGGFHWEGIVQLEAWRGFIPLQELCPWVSRGILPDGNLHLNVGVSSADHGTPTPPTRDQVTSFQHLLDQQASLRDAALQAVFADYPRLRECYGDFVDEQAMPEIAEPRALLRLIRPSSVHIMDTRKTGSPESDLDSRARGTRSTVLEF